MKQTTVEWLLNQMDLETISKYDKQLLQAKVLEKQQIIDTYIEASENPALILDEALDDAEQYYNETFNKETK